MSADGLRPTVADEQRRGGISFEQADKNAEYIKSCTEVKVITKPELARDGSAMTPGATSDRRRSSLLQDDLKALEKVGHIHYRTRCGLRFLSLHRVRRRLRPALKFSKDNSSILDVKYPGQANCLLATVGEWDFNMFTLNKLTNGRALFHTSLHLFQDHNLVEHFQLDIVKLMRFISLVEEGYHSSNPYHNSVHAADVAQAMHCYLKESKLHQSMTPVENLGAIISAITHDLDHPGVNQAFLISTSNHLAALYNNTSVLENHHWRSAIGLLHETGLLDHFDSSLWKTIEWHLKSLILATDITRQQEFLGRLKTHLQQKDLDMNSVEHKNFILQITLKCADICNPCRTWELSKRWSELVCDEFFKQGDCERQLSVPVTPLCDRFSTTVPKIQIGFMKFVVKPLFEEWFRFNPTALSERMISNIQSNQANWERAEQEAETQKMKEQETLQEETEEDEVEADDTSSSDPGHVIHTTVVVIEQEPLSDGTENEDTVEPLPDNVSKPSSGDGSCSPTEEYLAPLPGCLYRRHSLPPPLGMCQGSFTLPSRRDSFPRSLPRRYSLPVGADLPSSNSFDKLVDKLASLVECSPTNGTHFDYDQRPRVVSISQSLDAETLSSAAEESSKQTSAHGLDPVRLAQRRYTSEPHIAQLAHQYRLNNRHPAHITKTHSAPSHAGDPGKGRPRGNPASSSHQSLPCLSGPQPGGTVLSPGGTVLSPGGTVLSPGYSKDASSVPGCRHNHRPSSAAADIYCSSHRTSSSSNDSYSYAHRPSSASADGCYYAHRLSSGSADGCCLGHRPSSASADGYCIGHMVSLDEGKGVPDERDPLIHTSHCVDALSGVDTADLLSYGSSNPSNIVCSASHKLVARDSSDSNDVSMAICTHDTSASEEELPLLMKVEPEGHRTAPAAAELEASHSNNSFTH